MMRWRCAELLDPITPARYDRIHQADWNRWPENASFESMAAEDRAWIAVTTCMHEVMNPGFCQYFENSYSDNLDECLRALGEVRETRARKIVSEASEQVYRGTQHPNRTQRRDLLDTLDENTIDRLDDLGDELCGLVEQITRTLVDRYADPAD